MKFVFAIWLVVGIGVVCSCRKQPPPVPPPPKVSVVVVNPKDTPVSFEYVGQTQSSQNVNIHARVSGFLDRRVYTEGALVQTGQVLFQMDAKPFAVQLDQAQAALLKQQAALEVARLNLARVKPLAKTDVVAKRELDDATGQYESAAAAVEQAKAQVETAKLNLSYTTIASPVTGMSSSAKQADGTYVNPQNSLLTTIAVLSPIWINFSISENELQRYRTWVEQGVLRVPRDGSYEVEVILVDGSLFPHKGRITFAEPSYSTQTGTFLIRTSVENPKGTLRPNQFVHVRLNGAVRPGAILVPQRAVQQGSRGQFVWVVNKEDKAELRPVTVGEWQGENWFITEGLHAGERVAVDGTLDLQPGIAVSVKQ
ncbi:efflux RND transporter periplasmic adaptor subunit [bacterium]|nr:efflux RND transporter periplasmic adaptor subunit [bacterium]